jgi:hypothetical protein
MTMNPLDQLHELVFTFTNLEDQIRKVGSTLQANLSLSDLLEARDILAVGSPSRELYPCHNRSEDLISMLRNRLDLVQRELLNLFLNLDAQITRLLDAGQVDERLIRTAEFKDLQVHDVEQPVTGPQPFILGPIGQLPPEHPYRKLVPASELFHGALVLGIARKKPAEEGSPFFQPIPQPWYLASDAVRLTRKWSAELRQHEAQRKHREEVEQQRLKALWENQPEVKISKLQARVEALLSTKDSRS